MYENPKYEISNEILEKLLDVSDLILRTNKIPNRQLKVIDRSNRIKTIYSTNQIENNPLTLTAAKNVINSANEPEELHELEIYNTTRLYNFIDTFKEFSEQSLLNAHSILMKGLIEQYGQYRTTELGVTDGTKLIHIGVPANYLSNVMIDFIDWVEKSEINQIILSIIVHYELAFIHPFQDGNGRIARFFQQVILNQYSEQFNHVSIESEIMIDKSKYYESFVKSDQLGNINPFILYQLEMIQNSLLSVLNEHEKLDGLSRDKVNKLLGCMELKVWYSRTELMKMLKQTNSSTFARDYLSPAIRSNCIKLKYPTTPKSKQQLYSKLANNVL